MQIMIEGQQAQPQSEADGTHVYTVTLSEQPMMTPERFERYVVDMVKAASGAGEWIIDGRRKPRESTWQPYVSEVNQLTPLQWTVTIIHPFTDYGEQGLVKEGAATTGDAGHR